MADYGLAPKAAEDLEDIFYYTIDRWGFEQAQKYKNALTGHFSGIALNRLASKAFIKSFPEPRVSRCEHHCVFHVARKGRAVLIIAVLREKMDLLGRIKRRLED